MVHILFGRMGHSEPLWYCITKLSTNIVDRPAGPHRMPGVTLRKFHQLKGSAVARIERSEIRERCCKSLGRPRISLTLNAGYMCLRAALRHRERHQIELT